MTPSNLAGVQQQMWSEMLCCPKCKKVYSLQRVPVTLCCGHLLCLNCIKQDGICPFDKNELDWNGTSKQYVNGPVLSIAFGNIEKGTDVVGGRTMKSLISSDDLQYSIIVKVEELLYEFANFMYKVDSEKGATVSSNRISRTIQRKLLSLLCVNFWQKEGNAQLTQIMRSMSERIVSELILCIQSNFNLSSSLWTAVRGRGCQFLGPAMQEDVLRLILHTLKNGESIARKTLVLYVVETLSSDYPHVSKTCVGHVVQLLYRASCFNVIKREGESSLMQLKEQFREYESLRIEHDSQIVQIAMEAGLRISPDQWSSLLYGDTRHRTYMQSVCDRLSNNSLQNAVDELRNLVSQQPPERNLFGIQIAFDHFDAISKEILDSTMDDVDWSRIESLLRHLLGIVNVYSKFIMNRNSEKEQRMKQMQSGHRLNFNQRSSTSDHHDIYHHRDYPPASRTPLKSINPIQQDFGYSNSNLAMPSALIYPPPQPPSLSNYFEHHSFPMGTPPRFIAPMPLNNVPSPPIRYPNVKRDCSVGPPPPNLLGQQQIQIDPLGQFISLISPTQQFVPALVDPIHNVSTTANTTLIQSTIVATTTSSQMNCNSLMTAGAQPTTTLYSVSPSLQVTPAGQLVATPPFTIPVQSQPVILYGSTPPQIPFGSPPFLFSQFTNWVAPMEAGGLVGGTGFFNLNPGNTTITTDSYSQKLCETSFESDEDHANFEKNKCRQSSRGYAEEDDSECHVSFTVANSVLHGHEDSEHSFGSFGWNLELPSLPVGQLNLPIPISPSNVTYTVARDSAQPNLCTIIRTTCAAGAPPQLIPHIPIPELVTHQVENVSVS